MTAKNHIFAFGDFVLDTKESVLRLNNKPVSVTPKVIQVLSVLVANRGHIVEKSDLLDSVWGDSVVEEGNIPYTVGLLRKVLNDDSQNPRFIETVPRRGYRFIADVCPSDGPWQVETDNNRGLDRLAPGESSSKGDRPGKSVSKRTLTVLMIGLAVGSVGTGFYSLYDRRVSPTATDITVAVLPMRPIDSASRSENYEIGIADSVINRINSMNGVLARPLDSIRKYSDLTQDPIQAGKEQEVDYVLTSSYQVAANRMRVTWQLISIETGRVEQAHSSEDESSDLFSRQDAISTEIGNKLLQHFRISYGPVPIKRGTDNEESYMLYLEGMYLYDRRTAVDAQKAVEKFGKAIELDPNYALAWAGKAHAHRSLGNFGGSLSPHEQYRMSMTAVDRSLALDKNLSDAHSALCENKFFYEYDYEGAETACKRAIELDRRSYLAHEIYSRCLWTQSRFDEAIAEAKMSIDSRPTLLFTQRNYGISLFYARRYEEASHQFKRVSEMDPTFVANYAWFIPAMLVQGRLREAFDQFIIWQQYMGLEPGALDQYRSAFERSGWHGVGDERLKHFDENKIRSYFLEACLTAHTGNVDKTFEYLEKSYERREWGIPFLRIDPSLDAIRSDPRFEDLVRRVETGSE